MPRLSSFSLSGGWGGLQASEKGLPGDVRQPPGHDKIQQRKATSAGNHHAAVRRLVIVAGVHPKAHQRRRHRSRHPGRSGEALDCPGIVHVYMGGLHQVGAEHELRAGSKNVDAEEHPKGPSGRLHAIGRRIQPSRAQPADMQQQRSGPPSSICGNPAITLPGRHPVRCRGICRFQAPGNEGEGVELRLRRQGHLQVSIQPVCHGHHGKGGQEGIHEVQHQEGPRQSPQDLGHSLQVCGLSSSGHRLPCA
mmetsp:Transcript_23329/g.68109  ORF Transcript_23329/g.68109 Transcript_23329/m.68109 type:complete len:250 (-) Transcript_23329:166-915(-)